MIKGRHGSGNKGNFESGQNKNKACSDILKIENATLCSLPWTKLHTLFQKRQHFAATDQQQLCQQSAAVSTLKCSFNHACPQSACTLGHMVYGRGVTATLFDHAHTQTACRFGHVSTGEVLLSLRTGRKQSCGQNSYLDRVIACLSCLANTGHYSEIFQPNSRTHAIDLYCLCQFQ